MFPREEINGGGRCPTYLYRWILLKTRWAQVYLHHFVGDDWSLDLHDHPKRFVTIGLWGMYWEFTPSVVVEGDTWLTCTPWVAPWIRTFPAEWRHRIEARDCWTLVIVFKPVREWGFWHNGLWVHWREYVAPGSVMADKSKACP